MQRATKLMKLFIKFNEPSLIDSKTLNDFCCDEKWLPKKTKTPNASAGQ